MGPKEFGYRVLADLAGRRCQRDVDEFLVIRNQLNPIDLQKDQSGLQANPFVAVDERVVGNDVEKMCRCHLLQIAEREAAPGSGLARGFAGVRPCERLQRLRRGQALCSVLGRGSLEGERLRRGEASPGSGLVVERLRRGQALCSVLGRGSLVSGKRGRRLRRGQALWSVLAGGRLLSVKRFF